MSIIVCNGTVVQITRLGYIETGTEHIVTAIAGGVLHNERVDECSTGSIHASTADKYTLTITIDGILHDFAVLHYRTVIHVDAATALSVSCATGCTEHIVLHKAVLQYSATTEIYSSSVVPIGEVTVLYGEAFEGGLGGEGRRHQEHTVFALAIYDGLVAILRVRDVALVLAWITHSGITTTHIDTRQPFKVGVICAGTYTHLAQTCLVFLPLSVTQIDGILETVDIR